MLTAIVALILIFGCAGGIYMLLKSMGEEGVEVAAPGSCKSGQCGVHREGGAGCSHAAHEEIPDEIMEYEELRREPASSAGQAAR